MEQFNISKKVSDGNLYLCGLVGLLLMMIFGSIVSLPGVIMTTLKYNSNLAVLGFEYFFTGNASGEMPFVTNMLITFADVISKIFIITATVYIFRKVFIKDFVGFKKNFGKYVLIVVIGIFSMYMLSGIVGMIYELLGIQGDSANEQTIADLIKSPIMWAMGLYVVICAPIFEELLFRKFMFGVLEVKFKIPGIAVAFLSAFLFSLIHVSDLESLKFIFLYMAQAVPICLAYYFSNRNIYVVIAMHVFNNLVLYILYVMDIVQVVS